MWRWNRNSSPFIKACLGGEEGEFEVFLFFFYLDILVLSLALAAI